MAHAAGTARSTREHDDGECGASCLYLSCGYWCSAFWAAAFAGSQIVAAVRAEPQALAAGQVAFAAVSLQEHKQISGCGEQESQNREQPAGNPQQVNEVHPWGTRIGEDRIADPQLLQPQPPDPIRTDYLRDICAGQDVVEGGIRRSCAILQPAWHTLGYAGGRQAIPAPVNKSAIVRNQFASAVGVAKSNRIRHEITSDPQDQNSQAQQEANGRKDAQEAAGFHRHLLYCDGGILPRIDTDAVYVLLLFDTRGRRRHALLKSGVKRRGGYEI